MPRTATARRHSIATIGMSWLVIASVASAETTVSFELGLGGSNNAARCLGAGYAVLFSGHNPTENQQFTEGDAITWSVAVQVDGTHVVNDVPYATPGLANFVFDLELHAETEDGPLVPITFHSTVNDGLDGCLLEQMAFAYSMNVNNAGPSPVIAPYTSGSSGGLKLDQFTYPNDALHGALLGMGAGYTTWVRTGDDWSVAGLGRTSPPCDPVFECQGTGPLCEGQISGLAPGTYVLKLAPCGGNNVLRGDKDFSVSQSAFAIEADVVDGDTITFVVASPACVNSDFDCDGDVDLSDFGMFTPCFNGPNRPPVYPSCGYADIDNDGDVDLTDFAVFQQCFNGPNRPPAAACP